MKYDRPGKTIAGKFSRKAPKKNIRKEVRKRLCSFACAMQVLSKIEKKVETFRHSGNAVQAGLSNHSALLAP